MNNGNHNEAMPFLSGIIHQLRNWIGGIIGYSDLALASENPGEMKESLAITLNISEKMTELLDVFSRFRNEQPGISLSGDLAEIGREVSLLTDNWLREKGLEVLNKLESAPVNNTDLALARLTLLENINRVAGSIPRGGSVEYRSGLADGLPFVGFFTRMDPPPDAGQSMPVEKNDRNLKTEFKIEDSGDCGYIITTPANING